MIFLFNFKINLIFCIYELDLKNICFTNIFVLLCL